MNGNAYTNPYRRRQQMRDRINQQRQQRERQQQINQNWNVPQGYGQSLGGLQGHYRQMQQQYDQRAQQGQNTGRYPTGTAGHFFDSYGELLQNMRQQGLQGQPGVPGTLENVIANFRGDPDALAEFLDQAGPFMAASMAGTPAFQAVQNWNQFSDAEQAYGAGAGQIAAAGQRGLQQAQQNLASQGLGRSAASASLASDAALSTGAQQADLYTRLRQQNLAQRFQMAQSAFDQHRLIGQLALGQTPAPRQESGDPWMQLLGGLFSGLGSLGGAAMLM